MSAPAPDRSEPDEGPPKARPPWRTALLLAPAILFLLVFWYGRFHRPAPIETPRDDAVQYLLMGYNLRAHGTLSVSPPGAATIEPTAYRLPVYPLLLAAIMELSEPRDVASAFSGPSAVPSRESLPGAGAWATSPGLRGSEAAGQAKGQGGTAAPGCDNSGSIPGEGAWATSPGLRGSEAAGQAKGQGGTAAPGCDNSGSIPGEGAWATSILGAIADVQLVGVLVAAFAAAVLARFLTRSWLAAYLTLYLVGLDAVLGRTARAIGVESLETLLVALFSLFFYLAVSRRRFVWYALAGVLLAVLTLTSGHFYYFLPIALVFLLICRWPRKGERRRVIAALLIFCLLPLAAVEAWKARNQAQFGRWYLTERGGVVVDLRAEYDLITPREYLASFLYFPGGPQMHRLLERYFTPADYARLDRRMDNPKSIYRQVKRRRDELTSLYHSSVIADRVQFEEGLAKIKAHPLRHLLLCLPIGLGGLCVTDSFVKSFFLFAVFGGVFLWALVRRRAGVASALLLSMFSYAFFTCCTHGLARYNLMLIPILYLALAVALAAGMRRLGELRRQRRGAGAGFTEKL